MFLLQIKGLFSSRDICGLKEVRLFTEPAYYFTFTRKIMNHVDTRGLGCKPNKIAKSRVQLLDHDDDDFDLSHGHRNPGLVKKKGKGQSGKRHDTEVGLGNGPRTKAKPNNISKSGADVIDLEDNELDQSYIHRNPGLVPKRCNGQIIKQRGRAKEVGRGISSKSRAELQEKLQESDNKIGIEFCPICQFPFRNLIGQTVEWHVNDCLKSRDHAFNLGECPKGHNCTSISQKHFRLFLHTEQAYARSDSNKTVTDSTTTAQTVDEGCGSVDSTVKESQQASVKKSSSEESMSSSSESSINYSFSDDSYERILTELVDELEDDDLVESDSRSCDADCTKDAMECAVTPVTSGASCKLDDGRGILETANTAMPTPSVALTTPSKSDVACKPSSMEAGKMQQTNLRSYFGLKEAKAKKSTTSDQGKFKFQIMSSFTNHVAKDGKGEPSNYGSYAASDSRKVRTCPFYKKIPGTSITVDAFSYGSIPGCTAYFLSHFHYDHYGGLKRTFTNSIYCSKVTAQLILTNIKVNEKYIHSLPMNEEVTIGDVRVTLLDANHCPGSVMFLFVLPNGSTALHTGDFRADVSMGHFPQLQNIKIDTIFLDTTYCNPSYNFPTQQSTIDFAVEKSCKAVQWNPKTLIVCGTYSVGKERVFVSIANALECKICVTAPKRRILNCLDWPELSNRLTAKWGQAQVHVLPMNQINEKALKKHLSGHSEFQDVLAFKPTGWTHKEGLTDLSNIRPTVSGPITIYGIPYSEHSSFSELKWFIKQFRPGKIIPTVNNGSYAARTSMQKIFNEWLHAR